MLIAVVFSLCVYWVPAYVLLWVIERFEKPRVRGSTRQEPVCLLWDCGRLWVCVLLDQVTVVGTAESPHAPGLCWCMSVALLNFLNFPVTDDLAVVFG